MRSSLIAALAVIVISFLLTQPQQPGVVPVGQTGSPSTSPSPSISTSPSASASPSPSPTPSPSPSGPSALTLAVTPAAAVWGAVFTARGSLVCFGTPIAGALVRIDKRVAGTFTFGTLGTRTTATDGTYTLTHKPDRNADYRALIPGGTGSCNISASPVRRAEVRVGVAANVVRSPVGAGTFGEIAGAIAPAHPGKKVYLQVLQGTTGTWANAAVAALDSSGRYRLSYRRTSRGYLLFRAVFPSQDVDHAWNVGRILRIDWT